MPPNVVLEAEPGKQEELEGLVVVGEAEELEVVDHHHLEGGWPPAEQSTGLAWP